MLQDKPPPFEPEVNLEASNEKIYKGCKICKGRVFLTIKDWEGLLLLS